MAAATLLTICCYGYCYCSDVCSSVFVQMVFYCGCRFSNGNRWMDICPIGPKFQLGSSLSHVEVQTIISRKVSVLLFLIICYCFYVLLMAVVSCYGCCCVVAAPAATSATALLFFIMCRKLLACSLVGKYSTCLFYVFLQKKSTRGKNARKWLKYDHTSGSQSFVAQAFKFNEEHSCKGPSENQIKLHSNPVKADCFGKFQAEESDEATCKPSNSDLHEWGQSNLMDTIPRAGNSSSQAFSSRSLHPSSRFLSRFNFISGNVSFRLSRATSLGSSRQGLDYEDFGSRNLESHPTATGFFESLLCDQNTSKPKCS